MKVGKKMIEFFMAMIPPTVTYQEKKTTIINGKPVYYEPEQLKDARAKLTAHLSKHIPEKPLEGALRLTTKWCFVTADKDRDGKYKTTKPDTDNLQKMLKDIMTDLGYYKDDALITSEITEKFWSRMPGIYIKLEKLE